MMAEPAYRRRWQNKTQLVSRARRSSDGGRRWRVSVLVTTTEERGIDSALIQRQLKELLAI
jgi:hypothetical protein